jgi:predicted nuclease of predicted toxin-antitoxin system
LGNLRFLADVNVERPIIDFLRASEYDVKWAADRQANMEDEELIRLANRERRILVTNDKDFGELTFLQQRVSEGIILVRVKGQATQQKIGLLRRLLNEHSDKLQKHFVVVSRTKFRFIPIRSVS